VGAVSYLNSEPLVYGLEGEARFALERDVPARVAERLHSSAIDLGLIPSIEYAGHDYAIVPGIAIACRGEVRSVCLFHHGELGTPRRVALDTSSRTSVALIKVLLRARLGRDPEYVPMAPDVEAMLAAADAALVIGDRALACDAPRLDLGAAWLEQTGLPFVFAFWAGRPGALTRDDVRRLQRARREGLARAGEIAAAYTNPDPARAARQREYLTRDIVYDLGADELAGLREFYRRAHALGLIPSLPEPRFHDEL
jgi:predicted solute-binding protein